MEIVCLRGLLLSCVDLMVLFSVLILMVFVLDLFVVVILGYSFGIDLCLCFFYLFGGLSKRWLNLFARCIRVVYFIDVLLSCCFFGALLVCCFEFVAYTCYFVC